MEAKPSGSDDVRNKMKEYASKMKHKVDANSLRMMLREKCRVRMREARQMKFDKGRGSPMQTDEDAAYDKVFLSEAILAEIRELNENLNLEQEIMDEFFAESFEWALKELENEADYYSSAVDDAMYIICPVCLLGELSHENNKMKCRCGLQVDFEGDPKEFRSSLEKIFSSHQINCATSLTFYTEPNEHGRSILCAICKDCDFFHQL